jgi:hypothetical protein
MSPTLDMDAVSYSEVRVKAVGDLSRCLPML